MAAKAKKKYRQMGGTHYEHGKRKAARQRKVAASATRAADQIFAALKEKYAK